MLSVNYSQSTGKAEIDWKHFEKLTKKVETLFVEAFFVGFKDTKNVLLLTLVNF